MNRNPTPKHQRHDTHAAALRAPDSPVRGILNRLTKVAPPPLDCGGLLAFCVGTSALIDIGQRLLKEPAPEFLMLQGECQTLAAACIARFEAAGQADAEGAYDEYKTSHPAWAAVVAAGTRGHTRQDRSTAVNTPGRYGHGMSTNRSQPASGGHDRRDDPTVRTYADSWVEIPMVRQKAPEGDSGHRAQRSLRCPAESARARTGHKVGTGWAQSKKPPGWVAFASKLTR